MEKERGKEERKVEREGWKGREGEDGGKNQ